MGKCRRSIAIAQVVLHGIIAFQSNSEAILMPHGKPLRAFSVLGSVLVSACLDMPAAAQSIEAIDQLVQISVKPKDGLSQARAQVSAGSWLDALATLERVLASAPNDKQARLLHASILCRIDDPDGAKVEFAQLRSGDYKKAEWAAAVAPCNAQTGAPR